MTVTALVTIDMTLTEFRNGFSVAAVQDKSATCSSLCGALAAGSDWRQPQLTAAGLYPQSIRGGSVRKCVACNPKKEKKIK